MAVILESVWLNVFCSWKMRILDTIQSKNELLQLVPLSHITLIAFAYNCDYVILRGLCDGKLELMIKFKIALRLEISVTQLCGHLTMLPETLSSSEEHGNKGAQFLIIFLHNKQTPVLSKEKTTATTVIISFLMPIQLVHPPTHPHTHTIYATST